MRKGGFILILGILLILASLGLCAYNYLDDLRAGAAAVAVVEDLVPQIPDSPPPPEGEMSYAITEDNTSIPDLMEYPDYVLNPEMPMPVKNIDGYDYIGVLTIPAIERELPVIGEWSYPSLKVSPCRYTGSVYLDNMVICAHNYNRHFGLIKSLSYGDTVIFTDMDGNQFVYEVSEITIMDPSDIEGMTVGDWDLTLFTCTLGGKTRVTIRCDRCSES